MTRIDPTIAARSDLTDAQKRAMQRGRDAARLDAPPRYAPGDDVLVIAMPSRGALRVTTRKHSRASGWWYDVRDAEGYTWVIPEEGIDRRAGERREP